MKAEQDIKSINGILHYKPHFILKWGMTIIFFITIGSIFSTVFIKYPEIVRVNTMVSFKYINDASPKYMLGILALPKNSFKTISTKQQIIIHIYDTDTSDILRLSCEIVFISHATDSLIFTLKPNNILQIMEWSKWSLKKEYYSIAKLEFKENTIFDMVIKSIPLLNN